MKKQINLPYMEYYVETSQYFTDKNTLNKSEIHSPYKPNLIIFSVHHYHFKPTENLDYFKVLMNTTRTHVIRILKGIQNLFELH